MAKPPPRRTRTQEERRDLARAKLLDAAVGLIGERGLQGFSVAEAEERAGVGRGLAVYHFKSRQALVDAAAASVLDAEAGPGERGLKPMLDWMEAQIRRAAERDPRLVAALEVAGGGGADTAMMASRAEYWRRQTALLLQHLASARTLGQLREGLEPVKLAPTVLGQLHGEILRIVATDQPPSPAFLDLLGYALAPGAEPAKASGKPRASKPAGDAQPGLF